MRGMGVLGFFGSCGALCVAADKCFSGNISCICNGSTQLYIGYLRCPNFSICSGHYCNLTKCWLSFSWISAETMYGGIIGTINNAVLVFHDRIVFPAMPYSDLCSASFLLIIHPLVPP